MRIDSSTAQLFGSGPAGAAARPTIDIARSANRQTANRLGIVEGELPGGYRPIYSSAVRKVEEGVFETRTLKAKEAVYVDRAVTEDRDVYSSRDVHEMRDVYETQAVYEQREVYKEASVDGSRDLRAINSTTQAGIDFGSDFSVAVGDGAQAVIRFNSPTRITVTVDGHSTQFNHQASNGAFKTSLLSALNSIDGLSASLSSDGKLSLTAADQQSIKIADVQNGFLDFSRSPLAALGLTAGTTNAQFTGYEQVQTGTQQVKTGTEQVVIGSEQYVSGRETVTVGHQREKTGEREVVIGTQRVQTGTVSRLEQEEARLVGLVKSDDYGVGYLEILDRLKSGGSLPAGYIDRLFGKVDSAKDTGGKGGFAPARAAYAEARDTAARDEAPARTWPGPTQPSSDETRQG